jgi:hypothetical protein
MFRAPISPRRNWLSSERNYKLKWIPFLKSFGQRPYKECNIFLLLHNRKDENHELIFNLADYRDFADNLFFAS